MIEQGVGMLLAAPRAAAQNALQLGVEDDQRRPALMHIDFRALQGIRELSAGQVSAGLKSTGERFTAAPQRGSIQFLISIVLRRSGLDPRRRQRQHPTNILWRHEMPGRAQDVRAQDRAIVEGLLDSGICSVGQAQRQRPLRATVILRLHGTQCVHDRLRAILADALQALMNEAMAEHVFWCHLGRMSPGLDEGHG